MTELLSKLFVKDKNNIKSPKVRLAYGKLAGVVGIICNVTLFLGKLIVGTISGSLAISADAVNNLSDASSSVVTLVGFKMSEKPADKEHPFGHARIEYLSGLIVAIMIMVIGFELVRSSIDKIITPTEVLFSWVSVAVLLCSMGIKLWMAFFNRKIGVKISSATLEATYADSRNDVIATSGVLIAALVSHFFQLNLDGYMGLAVAIFIIISGIGILRDTINPLLGEAPTEEMSRRIAEKILARDSVIGVHDLVVHDYGPGRRFATVHVEMSAHEDPINCHDIIDNIEREFLNEEGLHLVIHYDPIITDDEEANDVRRKLRSVLKEINPNISMHDFRMVRGISHTNLIFDIVLPQECKVDTELLKHEINERLSTDDHEYFAVITVDMNYTALPCKNGEE